MYKRQHFNNALELKPDYPPALLGLAQIEDEQGNYEKAISLYKHYAINNLNDITPFIALSEIAKKQNLTDDMLYWLLDARDRFPGDIIPSRSLARYYMNASQPVNATKYIQEALTISPGDSESLFIYSNILIAQDQQHEAAAQLNKLLSITPDDADALTLSGKLYLDMNLIQSARKNLLTALNVQAKNALTISLLAAIELKADNYDKSLEYVRTLQNIDPDYHVAYLQEGDIWLKKQDYEKARIAFEKSWEKSPSGEAAQKLFSIIIHQDSFDAATKPLLDWLQDNPNDIASRFYLAYAFQSNEQSQLAINEYEKLLQFSPNDSTILNNLAWLYPLDSPDALGYAERAYRSSPDDPGILDTYGWVLTQNGHLVNGRKYLKIAIQKLPDNDEVQFHYATNLVLSGETESGSEILKNLIESGRPFNGRQDAITMLEKLSGNL